MFSHGSIFSSNGASGNPGAVQERERYALGVAALKQRDYQEALKYLKPLADKNDTRALVGLGGLHASAAGALRDEVLATELYRRAAQRGHAGAQYLLGTRYADGLGVEKNLKTAAEWFEKAANAGIAEAASSLARLHEMAADREKAIEWYRRAANAFRQRARTEDADAICRHLDFLAGAAKT